MYKIVFPAIMLSFKLLFKDTFPCPAHTTSVQNTYCRFLREKVY